MKRYIIKSSLLPVVLFILFGYACSTKERFERGYVSNMEPIEDVYDSTRIVTVSGQVFDLDTLEYEEEIGIVNLNLAGTDGKHYYVQVAPNWFLEAKGVSFQEGELITVTGSITDLTDVYEEEEEEEEEDLQGEDPISYVIVAREVKKKSRVLQVRDRKGNPLWYRQGWLLGRQRYIKNYLDKQKDKSLGHDLGGGPVTRDPRQTIFPRSAPLYP